MVATLVAAMASILRTPFGDGAMRMPARVAAAILALLGMVASHPLPAATDAGAPPAATYTIRILRMAPLKLGVVATLPADDRLSMSTTRPGDIAALDGGGWPAIVDGLQVSDAGGSAIATISMGDAGWRLAKRPAAGAVTLRYQVDYAPLSKLGWPAPRESAYVDADNIVLAGRSLFVTTPRQTTSRVVIDAPQGWHVATPWQRARGGTGFRVGTTDDLVDNLFVLSRMRVDTLAAGHFNVGIVAIGHWRAARAQVRRIIAPVARQYVRMMPPAGSEAYLMVLMPQREHGGESFRNSFAMNLESAPTSANRAAWGNTLAHELFHYWNGWRLRGHDYAATQWFQEGFTEYMANKALLSAGLITPAEFMQQLSRHLADYRELATPLDAPGTHKGPPLYGGGALVAFCWDVTIRDDSDGRRDLDEVFANLWRRTHHGVRDYDWDAIRGALERTSTQDWAGFHARHIAAREPLPVDDALHAVGLKRVEADEGSVGIEQDPSASPQARARWQKFSARR
jgi:predicted metalloprotease with PDZ domain